MHNCKQTRKLLAEQAWDQMPSDQSQSLLAELEHCSGCRQELTSLRSVLRVADQAMESALPAEGFWPGYHGRLRERLENYTDAATPSGFVHLRAAGGLRNFLPRLATASVPVPLAAGLLLLVGLSIFFAMNSRRSLSAEPSVVTRTVEVPVIQERTVTRVVYRDRNRRPARAMVLPERTARNAAQATDPRNATVANTPISLVGFKPTRDPKLTIIKGSYRDEK